MAKDHKEPIFSIPVLEEASSVEPTTAEGRAMLSEGESASWMARAQFVESALQLVLRDCDYQEFSRDLLLLLVRAVKCEAASILECDYQNQNYFFRASTGSSSDKLPDFTIPFGQGIVGHVCEHRQVHHVTDVQANVKHVKSIQTAVQFTPKNIVAAPIVIRGKVYAVVEFLNRVGADDFTQEDVEICDVLCGVASKVVEIRMMLAKGAISKRTAA